MSGIYIKGMKMPEDDMKNIMILADGRVFQFSGYGNPKPLGIAIPVSEYKQVLKVLKTERECVSRNCDRECGKCDLSLERDELITAYDVLISMFDSVEEDTE